MEGLEVCVQEGLPLQGHHDNTTNPFKKDKNFLHVLKNFRMRSWKIQTK